MDPAPPLVLSLTSVPPRFASLGGTLASLLDQGADEIRLTLPQRYMRFPDWDGKLPALPRGVRLCRSEVDYGPATKWLPAALELRDSSTLLLVCDDDWTYAPGWAARFRAAAARYPGSALTGAAYPVRRLVIRTAPAEAMIAQGFSGILFAAASLPGCAAEIPACAYAADDVWLSGILANAGLPVAEVPGVRALCHPHSGEAAPLQSARFGGRSRAVANRETAEYLTASYGVWAGSRARLGLKRFAETLNRGIPNLAWL